MVVDIAFAVEFFADKYSSSRLSGSLAIVEGSKANSDAESEDWMDQILVHFGSEWKVLSGFSVAVPEVMVSVEDGGECEKHQREAEGGDDWGDEEGVADDFSGLYLVVLVIHSWISLGKDLSISVDREF